MTDILSTSDITKLKEKRGQKRAEKGTDLFFIMRK